MILLIWVKPKQQIPLWGNDFCLAPHPRKPGRMLSTATTRKSRANSAVTMRGLGVWTTHAKEISSPKLACRDDWQRNRLQ
jgi:hypothetical protein